MANNLLHNSKTSKWETIRYKIHNFFQGLTFYKDVNSLFYYFLFLVVVGVLFFITSLIPYNFTTPFSGDYVSQQYAFYLNLYDDWMTFFKTGKFNYYDFNTYLGANNIASNSFYSLTDPFFFFVLLFPRSWIGQTMAISTILRIALIGLAFYGYLRYMGASELSSKISGLAFAFSGWMAWYCWFNCYTENMLSFILIIWGVERIIREKKPWLLISALFLAGLINYFFFACWVLLGFIYALWRFFQRIKKNSVSDNFKILGIGFVAFLTGILMASIVVLPSYMVALQSSRATSSTYLEDLIAFLKSGDYKSLLSYIFSWKNINNNYYWRNYFPIIEFFYPVMSQRGTPLTVFGNETYDNIAGSIYTYFPFIILLIPAIIHDCRKKNYWSLIAAILLTISLFTPFLYYMFFGFTNAYSRWNLFVTFAIITYVGLYLDHFKEEPSWEILIGGIFTLIGVITGAILAQKIVDDVSNMTSRVDITLACVIEVIYVTCLTLVLFIFLNWKNMYKFILGCVTVECVIMGALMIQGHGMTDYMTSANYGYALNESLSAVSKSVNKNDKTYFRAWSSLEGDSNKNSGERNDYNSTSFFHSVYNYEVADFIYWSNLMTSKTGWSGRYVGKRAGLDKFLGIKYYYVEKSDYEGNSLLDGYDNYQVNTPFDFEDVSSLYPNDDFYVFEDMNHIDFAFSFDTIYTYDEDSYTNYNPMSASSSYNSSWVSLKNDDMFLRGALLDVSDVETLSNDTNDLTYTDAYSIENAISSGTMTAKLIYTKSNNLLCNRSIYEMSSVAKRMTIKNIVSAINKGTPLSTNPTSNDSLKYVICIDIPDNYYDESGMVFYLNASYVSNTKEDVYLIDENDELITWDNHNDDRVTDSSSRIGARGFYVKPDPKTGIAPKVSKIILVPRWSTFNNREELFYESYTDFSNRVNALKDYPIENINFGVDHFDFTTNFDSQRFIVTQIAYDDGWSVTATHSDGTQSKIKTYKADGGFVSFLSETGEVSYSMDYETPYLKTARLLNLIGSLIFTGTLFGYIYIDLFYLSKKRLNLSL